MLILLAALLAALGAVYIVTVSIFCKVLVDQNQRIARDARSDLRDLVHASREKELALLERLDALRAPVIGLQGVPQNDGPAPPSPRDSEEGEYLSQTQRDLLAENGILA